MTQHIDIDDLKSTSLDDEQEQAFRIVISLINDFLEDKGYLPSKLYASDQDELQSWIMLAATINGCNPYRTSKRFNYVE